MGKHYALSWNTGSGTHLTLVYLEDVKRGYEQDRAKALAEEFMRDAFGMKDRIELALGDMWTDRCVAVTNRVIADLQTELKRFFARNGFVVRELRPPHIDLRGQARTAVETTLDVYGNWAH